MNINKEIYLLRLAITTKCILDCRYCFVYKNNRVMPYLTAVKAIEILLNSPGKQKILIIYGGEPLLCFDLVKKIIIFSQKKAALLKKRLVISLGTNGLRLNKVHLDFFKKTNTKLSISMDGEKIFHDKFRTDKAGKGSFVGLTKKLPLVFKIMNKENVCVLYGVNPSSVYKMYDNLLFLSKLGFSSINIEPILIKWTNKQKTIFLENIIKSVKHIYINILHDNFIFINSVNRELMNKRLSAGANMCPFFENLEVYPQGEIAFSPFLINSKNRNQYIIGNVKDGLPKKYKFCNYNSTYNKCKGCWHDYNGKKTPHFGDDNAVNVVLKLRDIYSIHLAKKIAELSKKEKRFSRYIQGAKKRIFE